MHTLTNDRLHALSRFQQPTRNVCLVSLNFPPSSIASVHRARHLEKYLPEHGWEPTIVCVDERDLDETLDWRLHDLVRKDALVHKIRALPLAFTRPLGITDLGLRTFWSLRKALSRLAQERRFDAAFITGWPFYQMLLGRHLKSLLGAPLVLDFQDPWMSAWGATQSARSKAGLVHRLASVLEPWVLRHADFVTSVSETQNADMAARYPWLNAGRMAAIPIGGDPDDFAALRAMPPTQELFDDEPNCLNLSYVGTFLPRSGPLFRTLFRAFTRLHSTEPALAARVRINFVGTSNQPNDTSTFRVSTIAVEEGVADVVREVPQRLPYLRALNWLVRSHGLLLIGSDEPHYTASKIYPALMSGRPYVALFHRASSAHSILSEAGGGKALAFESPQELNSLVGPLTEALRSLALYPESLGTANPAAYAPYTASAVAGSFAEIFNRLVR